MLLDFFMNIVIYQLITSNFWFHIVGSNSSIVVHTLMSVSLTQLWHHHLYNKRRNPCKHFISINHSHDHCSISCPVFAFCITVRSKMMIREFDRKVFVHSRSVFFCKICNNRVLWKVLRMNYEIFGVFN